MDKSEHMRQIKIKRIKEIISTFTIPLGVVSGIILSILFNAVLPVPLVSKGILIIVIFFGSFELICDTFRSLIHKKFALDYIALLAITVGLITGQYLVAAVIVLMLSGGNTLEKYGMSMAKKSLTALTDRIPNSVFMWEKGAIGKKVAINTVPVGEEIVVRKGEVVPLDGVLISESGLTDESSLTGEPNLMDKIKGDNLRSGTVNIGDVMVVKVTKIDKDSTYRKIIQMVQEAQIHKAPLIRLADRYSTFFTLITLFLAISAYVLSHDFSRVLAVLVIATPCPLILATPIALMGGMNAAAKKRIILKKLSSIEVLSRVNTIIFDKTGTITLGRPFVKDVIIIDKSFALNDIFAISEAIERNSLHPLAKAIVEEAKKRKVTHRKAINVQEKIGSGISATVEGNSYLLSKVKQYEGMAIQLEKDDKQVAIFEFEDKIKRESKEILKELKSLGLELHIFTGDKKSAAQNVLEQLGERVTIRAEMTPQDKKNGIEILKKKNKITAMVGDGINDAPALAFADVGMVFSNEEHTAASEAADIVFLGGDFSAVTSVIGISKRTIRIAYESILFGIGLSTVGMIFAVFGLIPAVVGAFLQEIIDIAVIFNALRASK